MSLDKEILTLATCFFEISQESFDSKSPWTIEQFISFFESPFNHYFIVKEEEEIVGFLLLNVVFEAAEIELIGVRKSYLRTGLGGKLLKDGISFLKEKEVETLFLEVRASNEKARAFYEKHHFLDIGVRKNYYKSPIEDAILLQLKI
ncbi:ribosomal protein S18-alanine N-acetyltransferase [Vagococcus fluvialis]|uniref:[Ribosomal protein bS18]-alanine N-acetyltransferase n=2 Tax=Vagococcus fluvialis TaxID=2738 RepID=A0A369ASM5_9ENTE|nr:ribosomal protein S18-alanine N-acetyltransferase [Vagococcus fluvialis]NKC59973.1 ribosomal protein S18-alanine N-acetyltransferase [Vagococcus fluvialis]NKD50770.1 ribosomal protein S18-alanine N-acetyltransferase [Vagococcus fluvialis]RCX11217.1 ribosomal-protein-alanine N-acetyltransferase [Vagococcus fluvialis]RST99220.1 ribosomal-protein-alanine N-acetyltransferase [Vagococcus fluvialis]UDM72952.1 ribosomal protein S18-alanine N-acetyltransferase [Vagococcus fluvialis]